MVRIGPPVQVLTILLLFYSTVQAAAPPGDRMKRLQFDAREKRLSLLEHKKRVDQNFGLDPRLEKELTGLYTKGDTYDATLFSQEHTAFKTAHNTIFKELSYKLATSNERLLYLDGRDASTTKVLLSSSLFNGNQLVTVNRHLDTCSAIKAVADTYESVGGREVSVVHDSAVQALKDLEKFTPPTVSYYFDCCGGAVEPLLEMAAAITCETKRLWQPDGIALGFSLTNASPSGAILIDRE